MKRLIIIVLSWVMFGGIALAGDPNPVGSWETESGEARYRVTLCGDGTELCAKLVWLRDDMRTPENMQYLNKYVMRGAKVDGPNTWRGAVDVYGETATGHIRAINASQMKLTGCMALLCQTVTFNKL